MSSQRAFLKGFQVVTNGDMSADIVSSVTVSSTLDQTGYQCNIGGSASGYIYVEISADYKEDNQGNVTNAGNWISILSEPTPAASQPIFFDIDQVSANYIRLHYVASGGTGTLNAFVCGKGS